MLVIQISQQLRSGNVGNSGKARFYPDAELQQNVGNVVFILVIIAILLVMFGMFCNVTVMFGIITEITRIIGIQ